jgi:hypothetical protein
MDGIVFGGVVQKLKSDVSMSAYFHTNPLTKPLWFHILQENYIFEVIMRNIIYGRELEDE